MSASRQGSSRIAAVFAALKEEGRSALISFIMTGDPSLPATLAAMHALVESGSDVIELGVPFSDPMADGPVIQLAGERALARKVNLAQVIEVVAQFRASNTTTPVVLMGYANPVERYDQRRGNGAFVRDAAAAGVDGVLVVDYPPESCHAFSAQLKEAGLDPIFLLAPTSGEARMRAAGELGQGYVYYVSLKGVTGAASLDTAEVARVVPLIRQQVSLPVGVGFGIRDAESARAVGAVADAVVIGSRLVQLMHAAAENHPEGSDAQSQAVAQAVRDFLTPVRSAMDRAPLENPS
ncbi:tryptophan synthase subunit alpha [Amphibiibacter pelophylacis]|uniref:Tryptophan synthase subunit alpha n=1 Tax=Amphibiibacter pelophylacis TaxID=1799477 RepID=A0ACC6P3B3_9BURK